MRILYIVPVCVCVWGCSSVDGDTLAARPTATEMFDCPTDKYSLSPDGSILLAFNGDEARFVQTSDLGLHPVSWHRLAGFEAATARWTSARSLQNIEIRPEIIDVIEIEFVPNNDYQIESASFSVQQIDGRWAEWPRHQWNISGDQRAPLQLSAVNGWSWITETGIRGVALFNLDEHRVIFTAEAGQNSVHHQAMPIFQLNAFSPLLLQPSVYPAHEHPYSGLISASSIMTSEGSEIVNVAPLSHYNAFFEIPYSVGDGEDWRIYTLQPSVSGRVTLEQFHSIDGETIQVTLAEDDRYDIDEVAFASDGVPPLWASTSSPIPEYQHLSSVGQDALHLLQLNEPFRVELLSSNDDGTQLVVMRRSFGRGVEHLFLNTTTSMMGVVASCQQYRRGMGRAEQLAYETELGTVEGYWVRPTATPDSRALIVHLHGGPNEHHRFSLHTLEAVFLRHSWAVLYLDYPGSLGRGVEWANASQLNIHSIQASVCQAVADHVDRFGISGPVFALGTSYGGAVALGMSADGCPEIDGVIAVAPLLDPLAMQSGVSSLSTEPPGQQNLTRTRGTPVVYPLDLAVYGHFEDPTAIDYWNRMAAINRIFEINTPVLIFQGAADTTTPAKIAQRFYRLLERSNENASYIEHPGGHSLGLDEIDLLITTSTSFIESVIESIASRIGEPSRVDRPGDAGGRG